MAKARKLSRPRKAASRKSYQEPEYDSDYDSLPEDTETARPSRYSKRLQAAYEEPSESDSDSLLSAKTPPPAPTYQPLAPQSKKRKTCSKLVKASDENTIAFKRTKAVHLPRKTKWTAKRNVPPWQTLPYHILTKIMKYAAYPLYKKGSEDTGTTKWLLKTSLLSRSFHEACLETLLNSPPLYPSRRAQALIKLLKISREEFGDEVGRPVKKQSSRISTDYRTKIHCLYVDANNLLAVKSGVALADLLENTPLLKSLEFYHNYDFLADRVIWAHPNAARSKNQWQYTELYEVLASLPQVPYLQNFVWNARFVNKDDALLTAFDKIHKTTGHFKNLKSMTIRNFILDNVENLNETVSGSSLKHRPDGNANVHEAHLMTWRLSFKGAFNRSQELKSLTLHRCNIFDTASITILPARLERLEIINCPFVNSEGVQAYLSERGSQMRELILKGNQYLSIEFMTGLKQWTPRLTLVNIDLTYHDPTSFQDTEPLYDSLMPKGPPTWPDTLQQITIGPLRQLSSKDAEAFYQSLVDAADNLKHLRVLEIRTLLNEVGWRDRAAMRTKWGTIFHKVFHVSMNPTVEPPSSSSDLSLRRGRSMSKRNGKVTTRIGKEKVYHADQKQVSQRVQSLALNDSQSQMSDSQGEPPSPTLSSMMEAFNENGNEVARNAGEIKLEDLNGLYGRCHTVLFELSDQRPAQDQFNEDDFLDDAADLEQDATFQG